MSMFSTFGFPVDQAGRKENTLRKCDRINKALRHEEPDRVPISDFFWGGFTRRWRQELGLPADANPYYHYDLDWIVTVPNMDPWIRPFETLQETRRGGGGQNRLRRDHAQAFRVSRCRRCAPGRLTRWKSSRGAEFDDPRDRRRFFEAGDNQIAGVGDGFERNSPAWIETVKSLRPGLPGLSAA